MTLSIIMHEMPDIQQLQSLLRQLEARLAAPRLPDRLTAGEARILSLLAAREGQNARDIIQELGLDAGYVSRMLAAFEKQGLIVREASRRDGRAKTLRLTERGRGLAAAIIDAEMTQAQHIYSAMAPAQQQQLAEAITAAKAAFAPPTASAPVVFRQLKLGDAGWIIHRHGTAIAAEFGWNEQFEALCAQIMADFIRNYDAAAERSWVVERDGRILGSLFLVREDAKTARLRLLYVEPEARGMGLAGKMLDKALRFAREKGYQQVRLFTTHNLRDARRLYERAGFEMTARVPTEDLGRKVIGETWEIRF